MIEPDNTYWEYKDGQWLLTKEYWYWPTIEDEEWERERINKEDEVNELCLC